MFCTHCGKELVEGAAFCTACGAKVGVDTPEKLDTPPVEQVFELKSETQTYAQEQDAVPATSESDEEARSWGKGRAITALVFGIVSFAALYISMIVIIVGSIGGGLIMLVPGIVLGILGVIKGAKSIGAFKEMGKQGRPRPVATLVMGIIGLSLSVFALFMDLIFSFASCSAAIALL